MTDRTIAKPSAPTLEAVAAHAGVSRATVSRVVNNSPKVTDEVVAIVNAAIDELGYVPNRVARSLASRKTQAIAVIVPETASKVFDDPFFSSIVQGVALHLAGTEYTLSLLMETENSSAKTRRYLRGGNVDGALIVSHHVSDHSYTQLGATVPMVFAGRPLIPEAVASYYVDVDNVEGARMATNHLIELGHTRIATIAGRTDMPGGHDRLAGWRAAMAAAGLDDSLVAHGDFSPADGAAAMRALLERGEPIDAVFSANDQMAVGAYSAVRSAGLRIPDDISIVGFDNDRYAATASPPLTTVDQSPEQMGEAMAGILLRLIDGDETVPNATMMPLELVVRESTAPRR
ncbi:LacI family DNA-binding transcriptional regulator [Paramicrobacterium agarici]|uniref:LacI family transcriptional regulator n=1 Tax=Paramicrobacterium agarici TaxID=630514 RepID=A0A2A9DTS4_9MICO|nr:LacI family DNA-binding transcriptional regulator [Microbacterium agarici]PFG29309.1 LacI family transcriptional regulator [Microbacterium agarici]